MIKIIIVLPNTYYIVASSIWSFKLSVSFNPPSNLVIKDWFFLLSDKMADKDRLRRPKAMQKLATIERHFHLLTVTQSPVHFPLKHTHHKFKKGQGEI